MEDLERLIRQAYPVFGSNGRGDLGTGQEEGQKIPECRGPNDSWGSPSPGMKMPRFMFWTAEAIRLFLTETWDKKLPMRCQECSGS